MQGEDHSKTTRPGYFAPEHAWDRNFFLGLLIVIWAGILMGFGGDIARHYAKHGLDYPLIVHIHAAVFVGWMLLLTIQVLLIRTRNIRLHMKLGQVGAMLIPIMAILGPTAEIIVDKIDYAKPGSDPAFSIVAFTGIFLFVVLATSGLLLRRQSSLHKRLMFLAIIAICNAGFSRWLGEAISKLFGPGAVAFWAIMYLIPTLLIAIMASYDLVTRRRLVPGFVVGALFTIVVQIVSVWLYLSPAWLSIAKKMLGH